MRDWKEKYIDRMGLIVALSGEPRFQQLSLLKADMALLSSEMQQELKSALRQRFAPSGGTDGCQSAMNAVTSATS